MAIAVVVARPSLVTTTSLVASVMKSVLLLIMLIVSRSVKLVYLIVKDV